MGFSCDCYDDEPEFHRVSEKRARKAHKCCECAETIRPGEFYEHASGKWEGKIEAFHTCERCAGLRSSYFAMGYCVSYGNLWSDHYEMLTKGAVRAREVAKGVLANVLASGREN